MSALLGRFLEILGSNKLLTVLIFQALFGRFLEILASNKLLTHIASSVR